MNENEFRIIPLTTRLKKCYEMIGFMCKDGRPPKMSIPVQYDDEDIFICETILEAIKKIEENKP